MVHSSLSMCYKMCCVDAGCPPVSELGISASTCAFPIQIQGCSCRGHGSRLTPTSNTTAITSTVFFCLTNVAVLVVLSRELLLTLGTGSSPWAKKESVFSRENMSGKIKNTFYLCFRFLKRLF